MVGFDPFHFKKSRRNPMQIKQSHVVCGVMLAVAAGMVMAGTGGEEFNDVWDTLVKWTQGTLGRIIAIAMVLVGVVAGVVRSSIMGFVVGVAAGMGLYNAPTVIESIMGATYAAADKVVYIAQLTNGLN
jgi:conjugal transfer pilus assembly protein TraA